MNIDEIIPRVIPASWSPRPEHQRLVHVDVRVFENAFGLRVLIGTEDRGKATGMWLHASVSKANRTPTWGEMSEVKDLFFGDRVAIQLHPPRAFYVNLHPYALHLWSRLDAPTVPPALYEDM